MILENKAIKILDFDSLQKLFPSKICMNTIPNVDTIGCNIVEISLSVQKEIKTQFNYQDLQLFL